MIPNTCARKNTTPKTGELLDMAPKEEDAFKDVPKAKGKKEGMSDKKKEKGKKGEEKEKGEAAEGEAAEDEFAVSATETPGKDATKEVFTTAVRVKGV